MRAAAARVQQQVRQQQVRQRRRQQQQAASAAPTAQQHVQRSSSAQRRRTACWTRYLFVTSTNLQKSQSVFFVTFRSSGRGAMLLNNTAGDEALRRDRGRYCTWQCRGLHAPQVSSTPPSCTPSLSASCGRAGDGESGRTSRPRGLVGLRLWRRATMGRGTTAVRGGTRLFDTVDRVYYGGPRYPRDRPP